MRTERRSTFSSSLLLLLLENYSKQIQDGFTTKCAKYTSYKYHHSILHEPSSQPAMSCAKTNPIKHLPFFCILHAMEEIKNTSGAPQAEANFDTNDDNDRGSRGERAWE